MHVSKTIIIHALDSTNISHVPDPPMLYFGATDRDSGLRPVFSATRAALCMTFLLLQRILPPLPSAWIPSFLTGPTRLIANHHISAPRRRIFICSSIDSSLYSSPHHDATSAQYQTQLTPSNEALYSTLVSPIQHTKCSNDLQSTD
jgi:hypothetical protein